MVRSELVARLQQPNPRLYGKDCEAILSAILDAMANGLIRGDRIELRGFGAFTMEERAARTSRNPRTGAVVDVEAKRFVRFKAAKEMRERLNPQQSEKILAGILDRS